MRIVSSGLPGRSHDGIKLVVGEIENAPESERFFSRTVQALEIAASTAPEAYANLRKDLDQIVLWKGGTPRAYQKFLFAAVVPASIALDAPAQEYAAWLAYTSGIALGKRRAQARLETFLSGLSGAERTRVAKWLATHKGTP